MGVCHHSSSVSFLDLRPTAKQAGVTASARMLVAPREQIGSEISEGTCLKCRGRQKD